MAKRQPVEVNPLPEEEILEAGEVDIIRAFAEMGGTDELSFEVRRLMPNPGNCQTYPPGEFSLDRIRDDYGSGKYQIKAKNDAGQYRGSKTITLVERVKPQISSGVEVQPARKEESITMMDFINMMNLSNQRQTDMMIMMQKSQTDMLASILGRPQADTNNPANMLQLIAAMKDLLKPSESNPVELLLKGLELGRDMGEGSSGADWMTLAAKGFDALKPAIEAQVARPVSQSPNVRLTHTPAKMQPDPVIETPASHSESQPAKEGEKMNQLQLVTWLKQQVRVLAYQASRESDPALYASVFIDNLPETIGDDDVIEQFNSPDALDRIALIAPEVNQYRQWFEQFRKEVIEQMQDVDQSDAPEINHMEVFPGDFPGSDEG